MSDISPAFRDCFLDRCLNASQRPGFFQMSMAYAGSHHKWIQRAVTSWRGLARLPTMKSGSGCRLRNVW